MNSKAAKVVFGVGTVLVFALISEPLWGQDAPATLSGAVTDSSGKALPSAKISVKNVATGQSIDTQTDASGVYAVPNLTAGDYAVSVSAEGFGAKAIKITLAARTPQTVDFALTPAQASQGNLPNAPSSSQTGPSLEDLGFPSAESQGNAKQQALLDKRTHMLKVHQRMGLITTIPLMAAIFSSPSAAGKGSSATGRDVHLALGAVAGDLYFITAYYAIRAPRVPGTETRGPIRVHKALAWIHGPGMILTPILGAIAYDQKNKGEKVHGIASAHMPVAIVTAGAFGAALASVSFKF
jgi:hypothetical protein